MSTGKDNCAVPRFLEIRCWATGNWCFGLKPSQDSATAEREFRSLLAINDNHSKTILSLDTIGLSRGGIRHRNLPEWLLEDLPSPSKPLISRTSWSSR